MLSFRQIAPVYPSVGDYLIHLGTFPFDAAFRFLPWTLFLWAPFCPAVTPLDPNPLLGKYLKTLFAVMFCLLWISPFADAESMMYLAAPAAALAGLNYWIVVIRLGDRFMKFIKLFAAAGLCASVLGLVFVLAPMKSYEFLIAYPKAESNFTSILLGAVASALGIVFAVCAFLIARRRNGIVWCALAFMFFSFALPFQGVVLPYRAAFHAKKDAGLRLRGALGTAPGNLVVYKMDTLPALYAEGHYLGAKIQTIHSARDLPKNERTVYVLSSVVPSAPERVWKRLHNETYRSRPLELWRGDLGMDE